MTNPYADPLVPEYLLHDLQRMMTRVAANARWYEQQWLGVNIWQLPEDLVRLQALVAEVKPQWIVETGTKFGGSAIFFASLLQLLGSTDGGVITVDIASTEEARQVFSTHAQRHLVRKAIVGDAASKAVVDQIAGVISANPGPTLVFLDDNHNSAHVAAEMALYSPLVTPGSYLIVADTSFADLAGTPVGASSEKYPDVATSNPRVAVNQFLASRADFARDTRFTGKGIGNFTDGFLRKLR